MDNRPKYVIKLMMLAIFLILATFAAQAIPIPQGMEGTIYELDGTTPVSSGIPYEITNLNTSQTITGQTNSFIAGYYSAALQGSKGDSILVRTYTDYNEATLTVTLNGVVKGADIILNTTVPELPPVITSFPELFGTTNQTYYYQVIAEDPNHDLLEYELITSPSGMDISSTGLISWEPEQTDSGTHNVSVTVSDGLHIVEQSYLLVIEFSNTGPIITTVPITEASPYRLYFYDVNATDPDSDELEYSLADSPRRMRINSETGLIRWFPTRRHVGAHDVVVQVTDGNVSVYQAYELTVEKIIRVKTWIDAKSVEIENNDVNETGIDVELFDSRPEDLDEGLGKPVYKYAWIEEIENKLTPIEFSVTQEWLDQFNATPEEIVFARFVDGEWHELHTVHLGGLKFRAETDGFSYFAITTTEQKTLISNIENSVMETPFVIIGKVVGGFNREVKKGTKVTIKNVETEVEISGYTGGPSRGIYSAVLHGEENDRYEITVAGTNKIHEIKLEDDITFVTTKSSFISGFPEIQIIGIFIAIIGMLLIVSKRIKKIKEPKRKKRGRKKRKL